MGLNSLQVQGVALSTQSHRLSRQQQPIIAASYLLAFNQSAFSPLRIPLWQHRYDSTQRLLTSATNAITNTLSAKLCLLDRIIWAPTLTQRYRTGLAHLPGPCKLGLIGGTAGESRSYILPISPSHYSHKPCAMQQRPTAMILCRPAPCLME